MPVPIPNLNQLQIQPPQPASAMLQAMEFKEGQRRTDIAADRNAIAREGQKIEKEQAETLNMFRAINFAAATSVDQEQFNGIVKNITGKDYGIKFSGQDMEQRVTIGGQDYVVKGKSAMILDFYKKGEEDPTWITDPRKAQQALQYMAKNGLTIEPVEKEEKLYTLAPDTKLVTGQGEQRAIGVPKKESSGTQGSKGTDFKDESALRKEFTSHPEVENYMKIEEQYQRAGVAIQEARDGVGSMNAVDQSLIQLLNRMLDPSSVVRESEYARTPEGMSYINKASGYLQRISQGGAGLNNSEREALYEMIDKFHDISVDTYNKQVDQYSNIAKDYGMDPKRVLRLGGEKAKKGIVSKDKEKNISEMSDDEILKGLTNAK